MAKDAPALSPSFPAALQNLRVDQLRAQRREVAHWLRLITAKRDLIAARVVPPLVDPVLAGEFEAEFNMNRAELVEILDLDAPLPSTADIRLLQKYANQASRRIAELDDLLQAW